MSFRVALPSPFAKPSVRFGDLNELRKDLQKIPLDEGRDIFVSSSPSTKDEAYAAALESLKAGEFKDALHALEIADDLGYGTTAEKKAALLNTQGVTHVRYMEQCKAEGSTDSEITEQAFLARQAFSEAKNWSPEAVGIQLNIANLLVETNRFKEAAEHYEQIMQSVQKEEKAAQPETAHFQDVAHNLDAAILMAQLGRSEDADQQLNQIGKNAQSREAKANARQETRRAIQHNRAILLERVTHASHLDEALMTSLNSSAPEKIPGESGLFYFLHDER